MPGLPAQASDLRESNRQHILAAIRRLELTARVDIARETGISAATVTSITADLVAEGLVEEVVDPNPGRETSRGRPRVYLRIRPDAFLVAGAKIANDRITVTLVDFRGEELHHHVALLNTGPVPEAAALVERLAEATAVALGALGRSNDDLSAIGVGLPGFIDAPTGVVYWSPSFVERNVDFRQALVSAFSCPVSLDNDANLAALAEQWFGYGRGLKDFLVVTIEHGVGMGIVLNGEIYRGTRGIGAEFGHTKIQIDGALCRCGQRGCLEAYVSDYALLREASVVLKGRIASGAPEQAQLEVLFGAAASGHPAAQSILNRASRMFGLALANLVNIFDPALIIFSGEQMRYDLLYGQQVLDHLHGNIIAVDRTPPEVRVHRWGDRIWARGAAAMAIDGLTHRANRSLRPALVT